MNKYTRIVAASLATVAASFAFSPVASAQEEVTSLPYVESDRLMVEFRPIGEDTRKAFHVQENLAPVAEETATDKDSSDDSGPRRFIPEITITPKATVTETASPRSSSSESDEILPPDISDISELDYAGSSSSSLKDLDISYDDSIGEKVVKYAMTQLGVDYVWGGTTPNVGVDCSGLIQWAYKEAGVSIPRTSWPQISEGTKVSVSNIKPGDVVGYNGGGHVALYIGDGQVVHAPYTGTVVQVADLNMMPVESVTRWAQ